MKTDTFVELFGFDELDTRSICRPIEYNELAEYTIKLYKLGIEKLFEELKDNAPRSAIVVGVVIPAFVLMEISKNKITNEEIKKICTILDLGYKGKISLQIIYEEFKESENCAYAIALAVSLIKTVVEQ